MGHRIGGGMGVKKRGMRPDLQDRLMRAEQEGCCVTAMSKADARRLNAAVRRGDLMSPAQGVYIAPETWHGLKPNKRDLCVMRTLQSFHPDWTFCGVSAALVYGLAISFGLCGCYHVTTSRRTHARQSGIRGVRRHAVELGTCRTVGGLRVTSIERTIFDCLREIPFREGLAIVDSALHKHLVTTEHLERVFATYPNRLAGRRKAIDTLAFADDRAESGGESVARAVMIERGFRLPELQYVVTDPMQTGKGYRVDFYWEFPDQRDVIGELDGREKYVDPNMTSGRSVVDVLADERLRESRVSGADAKVMRFSYAQVLDRAYFTQLLCSYGIPRDADIPWVAQRADDPEAILERHERLFLGRWLAYAREHHLPMPQVA